MTALQEKAIALAVEAAEADTLQSYTSARPFVPHVWVVKAIEKALASTYSPTHFVTPPDPDGKVVPHSTFTDEQNRTRCQALNHHMLLLVNQELQAGGHAANVLTALQLLVADVVCALDIPPLTFFQKVAEVIRENQREKEEG